MESMGRERRKEKKRGVEERTGVLSNADDEYWGGGRLEGEGWGEGVSLSLSLSLSPVYFSIQRAPTPFLYCPSV